MTEKSRFGQWRDKHQYISSTSRLRLEEFSGKGKKPRYALREATQAYKTSKKKLKAVKKAPKKELKTNKDLLDSKQAMILAKEELETVKANYSSELSISPSGKEKTVKSYTEGTSSEAPKLKHSLKDDVVGGLASERSKEALEKLVAAEEKFTAAQSHYEMTKKKVTQNAQEKLQEAKTEEKIAKKTKKAAAKNAGGTRPQQLAKLAARSIHVQVSRATNDVLEQDDTLSDVAAARYRFTQINSSIHQTKRAGRILGSGGKFLVKRTYNLGNRFYNLKKGKGFTVTPEGFSWHGKAKVRFRNWKKSLRKNKYAQTLGGAKRVGGWIAKPLVSVIKNPFTFKSYAIMFLAALFLALMGLGGGVAIQDEYDLNQTWLYLTKKDREKSTDKVDYWTNWEDSLLYINHQYDTISDTLNLKDDAIMSNQLLGQAYLNTLWDDLNKDEDNLKTIADLYKKKGSIYYLEPDELEDYEELLEVAQEEGKFASLLELSNPFYLADDPKSDQPLKISNRFGYIDKDKVNLATTILTNPNQTIYATMTGTVEVTGDDVTISDGEAKFTYKGIATRRVKTGDKVTDQDIIGALSGNSLTITYQKLLVPDQGEKDAKGNIKPQWTAVNPGFYFQKVEYTQATSVISSIEVSGDKAKRARNFYNLVKKHIPEATLEGVSGALGGFDIESGITFKRYETDLLTNNQFDKMAAEPTVENLVGTWSAFTVLYPGWTLQEDSYLVNGLHYLGLGIGQWTGLRALALWTFAKANNLDMWSEEAQIRFLLEGDSPYNREIFRKTVTGTGSPEELAEYFLNNWLGVPGNKLKERQNAAKQWHSFLKGRASGTTGVASQTIPDGYKDKLLYGLPSDRSVLAGQGYPGNDYELGNCTWYVYNRMEEIGTPIYTYLGNANMWAETGAARGYEVTTTPKVGSAAVFLTGVAGSHPEWGHVGFVEHVNADGTFLMSEMNFTGLYNLTWRTLAPQPGIYFMTPK